MALTCQSDGTLMVVPAGLAGESDGLFTTRLPACLDRASLKAFRPFLLQG